MGEAQIRSTFDGAFTYNVIAPGNGSAAQSISSLLSLAQRNEIALSGNGYVVGLVQMTSAVAFNYFHATPGNAAPFVVSPNSQPVTVNANQKPNEGVPVLMGDQRIFLQSTTVSAVTVQVTLYVISKDTF